MRGGTLFWAGEFADGPRFRLAAASEATAQRLEIYLRSGPMPAETTTTAPDGEPTDDRLGVITGDGAGVGPIAGPAGIVGTILLGRTLRR